MQDDGLIYTTKRYKAHPNLSRFGAEMVIADGQPVFVFDEPFASLTPEGWNRINVRALQWNSPSIGMSVLKQLFPDFNKDDIYTDHDVKIVEMSALEAFLDADTAVDELTSQIGVLQGADTKNTKDEPLTSTDGEKSKASSKAAKKIEDAGVKIGGAKKDRASRLVSITEFEDEILLMNEAEMLRDFNKAAIFPFNVLTAVKGDMPLRHALLIKHLVSNFPTFNTKVQFQHADGDDKSEKLIDVKKGATFYASKLLGLRDVVMTHSELAENYSDVLEAASNYMESVSVEVMSGSSTRDTLPIKRSMCVGQKVTRRGYNIGYTFNDYQVKEFHRQVERDLHADEFFNTSSDDYIEAKTPKKKINDEKTAAKEKLTPWSRPHLAHVERKGLPLLRDEGVSVTPEMLIETFGFRAVEFGNWLPDDERQDVLNRAYDSFYTLSLVTGIEPQNIGLPGMFNGGNTMDTNGDTGIALAFGARGNGGRSSAAAHWEPARCVMNLTRFNGAGSIAHEYGHALDTYEARILDRCGEENRSTAKYGYFASGRWSNTGSMYPYRQPKKASTEAHAMLRRMHSIIHNQVFMPVPDRSDFLDANGRFTEEGKTAHRADLIRQLEGRQNIAADIFAKAVNTDVREKFRKEIPISVTGLTLAESAKLNSIWTQIQTDSELSLFGTSTWDAFYILKDNNLLDKDSFKMGSMYFTMSRRLDSDRSTPYYALSHEMFARLFESFVEDKITARGGVDHYLVHGTAESRGDIRYPMGVEREILSARLDKLMVEMNSFINDELRNTPKNIEAPSC